MMPATNKNLAELVSKAQAVGNTPRDSPRVVGNFNLTIVFAEEEDANALYALLTGGPDRTQESR